MLLSWGAIEPHIDFYTVIVLEHGLIKNVLHFDSKTTSVELNNTNPCTHYDFSVGAKSNASNQFYDRGQIAYTGGLPVTPQVTYLGDSRVSVNWTTNRLCRPDRIHLHFRAFAHHMAPVEVNQTEDFAVVTGVKQYTMYTIQLGFSYKNGREYLSEPVRMTFFSVPDQPQPPFVRRDGSTLFVWWTNSNQTSTIKSHKLFVSDAMNETRIFEVQHPKNYEMLEILKEGAVYRLNLRAVNEEGESKSSVTVQTS
ncbi:hypothetical protein P879_03947 [Paragonimus westermani]|uniref:Fibronectin type-III domain-containing protein n=1 Tax=Paragonimus westermani TaxID=34504 RepID=A0A8T0DCD4_9TREM|nr:hypothetical protein P879_03947 [Paragonimus westermani]